MTNFDDWCRDLRRELLRYGIGGGRVLTNYELRYCWHRGLSIHTTFDISSDVANGFSFDDAVAANAGAGA